MGAEPDPGQDFKRSRRFGLVGVIAVIALTAAIALAFGQGSAHPTGALIAIFTVIFAFAGLLMYLQRRDLDRAESKAKLAAAEPAASFTDPSEADQDALVAALAVVPFDREAVAAAAGRQWELARETLKPGPILIVLIAGSVVPWELWQFRWSMLIGVPIILAYAVYLAIRAIGPRGTLDRAYDNAGPTIAALGLVETERVRVRIRRAPFGPRPATAAIEGATAYEGERHGRRVAIRLEAGGARVAVEGSVAGFAVEARGERLRAATGSPAAVTAAVDALRVSSCWKGVAVSGGCDGVLIVRKRGGGEHWMRDLWLAERLSDAATPG